MRAKLLVAVMVVAVAVLAAGVAALGAPASTCPRAVRGLGMVAVAARGRVEVMDLATCRTRVLARVSVTSPVGRANSPVVHFLGNGRWLVYATTAANGSLRGPFVVPVTGGRARAPLGSGLVAFKWAPDGSRLYGITGGGELVSAAPTGGRRVVAAGLGTSTSITTQSLAISPDGRAAAVDISRCGAATATAWIDGHLRRLAQLTLAIRASDSAGSTVGPPGTEAAGAVSLWRGAPCARWLARGSRPEVACGRGLLEPGRARIDRARESEDVSARTKDQAVAGQGGWWRSRPRVGERRDAVPTHAFRDLEQLSTRLRRWGPRAQTAAQ